MNAGVIALKLESKLMYKLSFFLLAAVLSLNSCKSLHQQDSSPSRNFSFKDISTDIGLTSQKSWKYGGPSLADFSGNGRYDFVIGNHDEYPLALWFTDDNGQVSQYPEPLRSGDVHGSAPADYDNDGDVDIIISVGGGNGTMPAPPRLLRNDGGVFNDVTIGSGLENLGARGRSVRWIDMDLDGDLDLLHVVARQIPGETGPRNTVFENIGAGKFVFRESPGIQEIEAERVLVTDFNNDHISDLVLFEPLSLWQGDGSFVYKEVTDDILPKTFDHHEFITAAADADIDNDGDRDLYFSRGKTYYQTANNSVDFDSNRGRLDLRDEGNESHDGISFKATGPVTLREFWHWRRQKGLVLPVYLGAEKTRIETPVVPTLVTKEMAKGFPERVDKNGWYLGYLGNHHWRLEWRLIGDAAWDLRASLEGVSSISPDWVPQNYNNLPDILLENQNGRFVDVSDRLPPQTHDSNWGVTHGDFDNDGYEDFFVYRFGRLSQRVPDILLRNKFGKDFEPIVEHGAFPGETNAHGDMGVAFDFDLDGRIDMLNGDDDRGYWYLYKNNAKEVGNHLIVNLGYSQGFTDPLAAVVTVEGSDGFQQVKDVGSSGAVHSQSLLSILHFGLGERSGPFEVTVRWRDGQREIINLQDANQIVKVGSFPEVK